MNCKYDHKQETVEHDDINHIPKQMSTDVKYVISIDGGGIRSRITYEILKCIEKEYDINIGKKFDLISGVSAGAVLSVLLAYNNINVESTIDCLFEKRILDIIFTKNVKQFNSAEPEDSSNLNRFMNIMSNNVLYPIRSLKKLGKKLGNEKFKLLFDSKYKNRFREIYGYFMNNIDFDFDESDETQSKGLINKKRCMILTYNLTQDTPNMWRNWENFDSSVDVKPKICDLIAATSAAVPYFPPSKIKYNTLIDPTTTDDYHIDGAFVNNNLSFYSWVEAQKLWPNSRIKILNLSSGYRKKDTNYSDVEMNNWGLYNWVTSGNIVDILCNSSSTLDAEYMTKMMGDDFVRITGTTKFDFLKHDDGVLDEMAKTGREWFNENKKSLDIFFDT